MPITSPTFSRDHPQVSRSLRLRTETDWACREFRDMDKPVVPLFVTEFGLIKSTDIAETDLSHVHQSIICVIGRHAEILINLNRTYSGLMNQWLTFD